MKLSEDLKVLLSKSSVRKMLPLSAPLDFWNIDHGQSILNAFTELASVIEIEAIELASLPAGYRMVAALFNWESACQAEGWAAFANTPESEFEEIIKQYESVGLQAEAQALQSAKLAWKEDPQNYNNINAAYERYSHDYSGDLDRLEYLTQYFCDNAEALFYLA